MGCTTQPTATAAAADARAAKGKERGYLAPNQRETQRVGLDVDPEARVRVQWGSAKLDENLI